jgi:hypothetical protein
MAALSSLVLLVEVLVSCSGAAFGSGALMASLDTEPTFAERLVRDGRDRFAMVQTSSVMPGWPHELDNG